MYSRIKNIYKRWNIPYGEEEQFKNFKNRVLHSFDLVLGGIFIRNSELQENYIKLVGLLPSSSVSSVSRGSFSVVNITRMLTGYTINFNETRVWNLLYEINDFFDLIKCIQAVFWLDIEENKKERFSDSIKEDIKMSGVPVNLRKTKPGAVLYPRGSKLLDEKLVNEILIWLNTSPSSLKQFQQALEMYSSGKYNPRDVIDKMRLSMELLLKSVLNNKKRLEKQIGPLGTFLKEKKTPIQLAKMYTTLLTYYSQYQNEYVKHSDLSNENELEFIIYLTGAFMRFLLMVGKREG